MDTRESGQSLKETLSPSNQSEGLQPPRHFQPAKGVAIPSLSATVEPTTGLEPGTSSFRGGRFAHCATWTPLMQNQLTMTLVSKEHASDSLHDQAGRLENLKEARPRKRRCKSYELDTEALPEY